MKFGKEESGKGAEHVPGGACAGQVAIAQPGLALLMGTYAKHLEDLGAAALSHAGLAVAASLTCTHINGGGQAQDILQQHLSGDLVHKQ